tara:strand:+ start:178 stop:375 length:198 start_codon:yes stop_codon:yes gene_type:complete
MFQIGDLVTWYELYGDIQVTKDYGLGVIVSISDICYNEDTQTIYSVYRSEKQDIIILDQGCIEKF